MRTPQKERTTAKTKNPDQSTHNPSNATRSKNEHPHNQRHNTRRQIKPDFGLHSHLKRCESSDPKRQVVAPLSAATKSIPLPLSGWYILHNANMIPAPATAPQSAHSPLRDNNEGRGTMR
jgi:hypothetical protein